MEPYNALWAWSLTIYSFGIDQKSSFPYGLTDKALDCESFYDLVFFGFEPSRTDIFICFFDNCMLFISIRAYIPHVANLL